VRQPGGGAVKLTAGGSHGMTIGVERSAPGDGEGAITMTLGFGDGTREVRLSEEEARSLATAILVAAGA
jgi:hypothetical protein